MTSTSASPASLRPGRTERPPGGGARPPDEQSVWWPIVADLLVTGLAYVAAVRVRRLLVVELGGFFDVAELWWLPVVGAVAWIVALEAAGLYGPRARAPAGEVVLRALAAAAIAGLLLGAAVFVGQAKLFSRVVFVLYLAFGAAGVAAERVLWRTLVLGGRERARTLVVGTGPAARRLARAIAAEERLAERELAGFVDPGVEGAERDAAIPPEAVRGRLDDLRAILDREVVDEVVVALEPAQMALAERCIEWCEEVGVRASVMVDVLEAAFPPRLRGIGSIPVISFESRHRHPVEVAAKRALDVVVSAVLLVLCAPVIGAAAVLVRATSRGPAFFVQRRAGLFGRTFLMYKIRTMEVGAEARRPELEEQNEHDGPAFKMRDDPRVTRVGRVLRRFSIDELPQLWNVLRGEMSLVGPRPPLPEEVARYERWQRRRLSVRPGMTCLWQVSGRSELGFDEWMRLDLRYIDDWSLALDLAILARTAVAVLGGRGSY